MDRKSMGIALIVLVALVAFASEKGLFLKAYQYGEQWIAKIAKPAITISDQPSTGIGHVPASTASTAKAGSVVPPSQSPATSSTQTSVK